MASRTGTFYDRYEALEREGQIRWIRVLDAVLDFSPASSQHWAKSRLFPESTVQDTAAELISLWHKLLIIKSSIKAKGEVFIMVSKRIYSMGQIEQ